VATDKSSQSHFHFRLREGLLILAFALSGFLLLALATYHPSDPSWSHIITALRVDNSAGRAGAWIADFFLYLFGYLAFLFPVIWSYTAWLFYRHRHQPADPTHVRWLLLGMRVLGFLAILGSATGLLALYVRASPQHLPFQSGGILGTVIGLSFEHTFNIEGTTLILVAILLIGITLFTGLSWFKLMEKIGGLVLEFMQQIYRLVKQIPWRDFSSFIKRFNQSRPPQKNNVIMNPVEPEVVLKEPKKRSLSKKLGKLSKILPKKSTAEANAEPDLPTTMPETPHYSSVEVMPKLSLLDAKAKNKKLGFSEAELEQRAEQVEVCLADFGVQASVVTIHPGPVVTRFELSLAAGTKVSKITSLAKDLARSLSVISVRVVEVIPGKSVIGLELPNPTREMVTLQEVLASTQYENAHSALTLALGKDIAGHPVIVDLAKMPHLLVAGTTGSGKSVCLNAMLLSLLYKSTPKELRLIMIDPKMLELSVYEGIPHLLTPVVTDMKDAAMALRWCVIEMERRYRLMASLGVRNVAGYNAKVLAAEKKGKPLLDPLAGVPPEGEAPPILETLPKIVVLADEFADMMVVVGKKVETLIARLAQKARAAGVHLIFATQRPSVDVITGLIKANIPTRIAFQVSSKVDSRTILDQQGAEQLLGDGDMLYLPPGTGVPVRVHGAFVSDAEVHRVAAYLKENAKPEYIDNLLDDSSNKDPTGYTDVALGDEGNAEQDPLYDQAVDFIARSRRVSVSSIQRRFKIGYNRAARIVEAMEAAGIVSSMEGSGQREVLVPEVQQ